MTDRDLTLRIPVPTKTKVSDSMEFMDLDTDRVPTVKYS